MMRSIIFIFVALLLISSKTFGQNTTNESFRYLNQPPPGLTPVKFAPGIVSLEDQHEFGSIFSSDGTAFYYAVDIGGKAEIRCMELKANEWTNPSKLIDDEKYSYNDQFFSPDERKLFFISDRPLNGVGNKKDYDIWYIKKEGEKWSKPINAGKAINSDKNEYYISFTKNGTMYFSSNAGNDGSYDIYASNQLKGEFQKPIKLGPAVNSKHYEADVFIAYDESYMIFCGDRPEGYGKGDLYISFKNGDGTWSTAKNMGQKINTTGHELCPFVTKDGNYFFYTSNRDIYWVDAGIIDELR